MQNNKKTYCENNKWTVLLSFADGIQTLSESPAHNPLNHEGLPQVWCSTLLRKSKRGSWNNINTVISDAPHKAAVK